MEKYVKRISLLWLVLLSITPHSFAESHLDRILKTKTLMVCTTGDYKPYSFLNNQSHYEGLDIEMVQDLAQSLDASIEYIPTTWKSLIQDFNVKQCDIAIGGISITLKRQQQVWFANSLGTDGKIPLVRCKDQMKYKTIQQMNQENVRVIEPQGGTNEMFVHQYLPKAQLKFSDNISIFNQLIQHQADIMITDRSEALYQQNQHPELCAINPEQALQYGEKAYVLPKGDMSWKIYIDQWLHLSQATGKYQKLRDQWMPIR